MRIFTVTRDFHISVQNLFSQHSVQVLPQDFTGEQADLVIFTGGEDINPARYSTPRAGREFYNDARDSRELQVFNAILNGKFSPTKVLGICRGLQLINVGLGGTLVQDLYETFGKNHNYVHPLEWCEKNPLVDIFPMVNSLHHQGILHLGDYLPAQVLAKEPTTELIEAVIWKDRFLAVQFHPEMMSPEIKTQFSKVVTDWVAGRISIGKEEKINKRVSYSDFSKSMWSSNATTSSSNSDGVVRIFLDTEEEAETW